MMDTEVNEKKSHPMLECPEQTKTGYHSQTCFKAVMFGKKAVSLNRKTSQ